MLRDYVPECVLALKTEANIDVIWPWFEKSLGVEGDVCEFGCYRGTLSIKLAFYLEARYLGWGEKWVYCFDTFEGFRAGDIGVSEEGFPRPGDYGSALGSYDELEKWQRVLRVYPVRGDVREECRTLARSLSFVWFDLDIGEVMEDVRGKIWHLISPETVIGVDDVGRPECGSVGPWVEGIEREGLWSRVGYDEAAYIGFYRKVG